MSRGHLSELVHAHLHLELPRSYLKTNGHSYGVISHGLYSYGLYSRGLYSYGLYSYGLSKDNRP